MMEMNNSESSLVQSSPCKNPVKIHLVTLLSWKKIHPAKKNGVFLFVCSKRSNMSAQIYTLQIEPAQTKESKAILRTYET